MSASPRIARGFLRSTAALAAAVTLLSSLAHTPPAAAQGLPLIRDTEIENLMNDYARPVFRAAGLGTGRISIRLVRNEGFNAFVVDGRNVFMHTGTLMQSETPNQVIGVIAHEAGHIAGGHLASLRARIARDQTKALLAQILGIGLMVAGGVAGGDSGRDLGSAGQGVLFGGNEVIMRSLLAERRSQEAAADQAGLSYLNTTKQSGRGMLETFERFAQQEYISDAQKDAFARSHPVATDRLARLRENVQKSAYYGERDTPALQERHNLMRAKLSGYLERPGVVFNRYPRTDNSLPARYARAIARFFQGGSGALEASLAEIESLIKDRPQNPYFWELKGDLLARAGRMKEAVPALRQTLKLLQESKLGEPSLIQVQLAHALQSSDPNATKEIVDLLRKSLIDDLNPRAYRLLGEAYYKQGRQPEAEAAIAQAYFLEGDLKQAQILARRAHTKLKPGTPEWLKNDDIINYKPPT